MTFVDLVFHVLAHVELDVPASAWDPTYVRWTATQLGPARDRELGELARDVERAAPRHELLAAAQRLAWLFRDVERARPAFASALVDLSAGDVDAPALLASLAATPGAELLFCACALEAPHHARLPAPVADDAAFERALADVRALAPALAEMPVEHVRALRARGRAYDGRIFVGLPGRETPAIDPAHAAWQAAHEATVVELGAAKLPFAEHEHAAIVLLAERAARAGKGREHRAWLGTLRAPSPELASLAPPARVVVEAALARG